MPSPRRTQRYYRCPLCHYHGTVTTYARNIYNMQKDIVNGALGYLAHYNYQPDFENKLEKVRHSFFQKILRYYEAKKSIFIKTNPEIE